MASTMQLEFAQAMSDFKTMFPNMDRDVIEAVLRANMGAVDATIDQLLAMSVDNQVLCRDSCDAPVRPAATSRSIIEIIYSSYASCPLQNETLRNELDNPEMGSPQHASLNVDTIDGQTGSHSAHSSPAKPIVAAGVSSAAVSTISCDNGGEGTSTSVASAGAKTKSRKWNPPMLNPLPPGFLRWSSLDVSRLVGAGRGRRTKPGVRRIDCVQR